MVEKCRSESLCWVLSGRLAGLAKCVMKSSGEGSVSLGEGSRRWVKQSRMCWRRDGL